MINGGEIWFEHLDGIYEHEDLVLKKLDEDVAKFQRPSSSGFVCFVFDETDVTEAILVRVKEALTSGKKHYMKVAFVGLNKSMQKSFKKELAGGNFAIGFLGGLEDAKEWLLPGIRG